MPIAFLFSIALFSDLDNTFIKPFNFNLIKGDCGPKGDRGPKGDKGPKGDRGPGKGNVTVTRMIYPSTLYYPTPQDLLVPNFQTYNIYPSGWYFTGTLTFPTKPCEIERIDIWFYSFGDSTLSINTDTLKYTSVVSKGAYQGSTSCRKFVYDENFAFFKANKCSKMICSNITITTEDTFIISSVRITYNNYEMNFQLLNY
jgi:hypothetical protein